MPAASLAPSRHSARQEEVLDVVEEVFRRDGLRRVRIGELAAEARCSRRTLYELAASKEELFLVVLDRMLRRIAQAGTDAIEGEQDPVKRVVVLGTAAADGLHSLGPTLIQAINGYVPARLLFERHVAAARTTLEGLIVDAIDREGLDELDAATLAEAIIALVMHFTDVERTESAHADPAPALSLLFELLVSGAMTRKR